MIRRFAARVVLRDAEGRALLFHWANREKGTDWWATPGGGIEKGEKAIDAARRELREECGVTGVALEGPAWRAEHFFRSAGELYLQTEAFFVARLEAVAPEIHTGGLDRFEVDAHLGHRWWSLEELEAPVERVYPTDLGPRLRAWDGGTPMPEPRPRRRPDPPI